MFWQNFQIPCVFPDRELFWSFALFSLCRGYPEKLLTEWCEFALWFRLLGPPGAGRDFVWPTRWPVKRRAGCRYLVGRSPRVPPLLQGVVGPLGQPGVGLLRGGGGVGGRQAGAGRHLLEGGLGARGGGWVRLSFEMWDVCTQDCAVSAGRKKKHFRPPLSKKSFPVGQVGKKTASQEVGIFFFFFPNFNFFKLECTGGKVKKDEKKSSSRPF